MDYFIIFAIPYTILVKKIINSRGTDTTNEVHLLF